MYSYEELIKAANEAIMTALAGQEPKRAWWALVTWERLQRRLGDNQGGEKPGPEQSEPQTGGCDQTEPSERESLRQLRRKFGAGIPLTEHETELVLGLLAKAIHDS